MFFCLLQIFSDVVWLSRNLQSPDSLLFFIHHGVCSDLFVCDDLDLPCVNVCNCSMFIWLSSPVYKGSLMRVQYHKLRNMAILQSSNLFTASIGSSFYILFAITAVGVVS